MSRRMFRLVIALAVCSLARPTHAQSLPYTVETVDSVSGAITTGSMVVLPSGARVVSTVVAPDFNSPWSVRLFVNSGSGWARMADEPGIALSQPHAMAADHAGRLHVVSWQYADSDSSRPVLQDQTPAGWTATVLDTGMALSVGLAVDANDDLWVCYLRASRINCCWAPPYELVVAHRTAGGWQRDSLVVPGPGGSYTPYPIAIDTNGHPHVLFTGADYTGLYHAVRDEAGWHTTLVDPAMIAVPQYDDFWSPYLELALAADGTPHAAYRVGAELRHAELTGSGWAVEHVSTLLTGLIADALAIGTDGEPRVAYLAPGDLFSYLRHIVLATRDQGAWVTQDVAQFSGPMFPLVYELGMTLDSQDRATVMFSGPNNVAVARPLATASVGLTRPTPHLRLALASANPMRGGETMRWSVTLPEPARVTLEAFDVAGRKLASSPPRELGAGTSSIDWSLPSAPAGGWFVRARSNGERSAALHVIVRR
ncbi:MAG: hypothetical protein ABL977_13615 [Candidatus Eisenbacteria bacterium]